MDFTDPKVIAIYAPNGSMKTSLAETFLDLSSSQPSIDRYFPVRKSKRSITDQANLDIPPETVLSIRPYDEELRPSEEICVLLVDKEKRAEFEEIHKKVNDAKEGFLREVADISKSKKNLEKEISAAFTPRDDRFIDALKRIQSEVESQSDVQFADILYDQVFDEKTLAFLGTIDIQSVIQEYIKKYNELLEASVFFRKGVFNYFNGAEIAKVLAKNGFFKANHSVTLKGANSTKVITNEKELEQVIDDEKKQILTDKELRKRFDNLQAKIEKNDGLRKFGEYLSNNEKILPQLSNLAEFKQNVLKSYFKTKIDSFHHLLEEHHNVEKRAEEIRTAAKEQQTLWEKAIDTFNERFHVPFKLVAKNRIDVILGQDKALTLDFIFSDDGQSTSVTEDKLLEGLSTGERKAFYVLNIIFEVERRKINGQETIFVIDDLADSFDYKNKYAIIEYLEEISKNENFYQIILTHNFDFFRTIQSRYVKYSHCYLAYKSKEKVFFEKATGIRNPFILDWKKKFFADDKIRIACIPFIRNIVEYTKGDNDPDYKTLTSLLHFKTDTDIITDGDLAEVFRHHFGGTDDVPKKSTRVVDIINAEMSKCQTAPEGINFENKIVLSIAIRLQVERFMTKRINDATKTSNIEENQTRKLAEIYKTAFPTEIKNIEIIDKVILMTPENIHLNSFMYEPILDMSDEHLKDLCKQVYSLK